MYKLPKKDFPTLFPKIFFVKTNILQNKQSANILETKMQK